MSYQKTVVKMGNGVDTDGTSVVEGLIVKSIEHEFCSGSSDIIVTPRGIGQSSIVRDGYHYCTIFMPCPMYEHVAASQWGVQWTEELQNATKDLKVLAAKLKSDSEAANIAKEAVAAMSA